MVRPVWSRLLRPSCWRPFSCCRQAQLPPLKHSLLPSISATSTQPISARRLNSSADTVANFPLLLQNGDLVAFNREIYMGPSPLGFVPGQVTASFTEHQTPSGTAPPLLQFSQSDLNTMAPPTGFSGNYDFTTNTMTSSSQVILFFAGNAPYDANRLYVQAFLWTEADDNIDLNNIKVAVSGTAVPEPSKPSYAWKQLVEGHHLC